MSDESTRMFRDVLHAPDPDLCPRNLRESIDRYVRDGVPTGDFLRAVLSNDLKEAIGRADQDNLRLLPHIVAYVYNRIPETLWGSAARVDAHLKWKRESR